jgi:hypothetical protein
MKSFIIFFTVLISSQISSQTLPKGFSYVSEIDATIKKELDIIPQKILLEHL